MKIIFRSVLLFLTTISVSSTLQAGTKINARLRTNIYAWQGRSLEDRDHLRLYQSFVFNAHDLGVKNLSFHTYLRTMHDFRSESNIDAANKIYNAYVDWKKIGDIVDLRLGRQFVHFGVGSMTFDGLKMTFTKRRAFVLSAYVGSETPFSREADTQSFSKNSVWGTYLNTAALFNTRIGLSYIQKERGGRIRWKQIGFTVDRSVGSFITFLSRYDFNLDTKDLHEALIRVRFRKTDRFLFYSDIGRRKPRIDADSYFRIFNPIPYDWLQLGGSYGISHGTRLHAEYRLTRLEDEQSSRISLSADLGMFQVGIMTRSGYGGSQFGIFGGASRDFGQRLSLAARINFSRFSLEEIVGDMENALFSYVRIGYVPQKSLRTELSVQHLMNPQHERELRALATVVYSFRKGG